MNKKDFHGLAIRTMLDTLPDSAGKQAAMEELGRMVRGREARLDLLSKLSAENIELRKLVSALSAELE